MKRFTIAAVMVAALAHSPGALAAGAPSGKYQTKIATGGLKGTWTITFGKQGAYTVVGPFTGLIRGKGKVSGTTFTFNHEKNTADDACGEVPGKYRFTITGKTLKLTRISDKCEPRRGVFSHKLTKVA
jgi:hypothetical protein